MAKSYRGWARARLGDHVAGLAEFREGLAELNARSRIGLPLNRGLLAELDANDASADAALAQIDEALAQAEHTDQRWTDALLHRIRGDILLRRDPSDMAPAEDAYRTAIAVSKAQGARTFELLAALALAKLHQSTGRRLEAHAVLGEALEGFPSLLPDGRRAGDEGPAASHEGAGAFTPDPSPVLRQAQEEGERGTAPSLEMPQIAEAQALLAALAQTDAVKAEAARRETRSKLHAGYALASMMTRGFGAEDTKAALARAEASGRNARTAEYWTLLYGRINADMMAGDHRAARAGAETFLAEAEADGLPGHAAFARRTRGFLKFMGGDLAGARADLEQALADYDERRDGSLGSIFGGEFRASALATIAQVCWALGDLDRGVRLADEAERLAKALGQPVAQAHALFNRLQIVANFDTPEAVMAAAEEMRALADAHDLAFWRAIAATYSDWARTRRGEPRADAFRAGLAAFGERGAKMQLAALQPLLVDLELAFGRRREALSAVDHGLALADETGAASMRPALLRLRGDALAEDDPAGALAAYREALREAQAQGARYNALLTALALAKRLQAGGAFAEPHAILRAALDGLPSLLPSGESLSPGEDQGRAGRGEDFPGLARVRALLAEARALLAALAETEEVKAELRKAETRSKLHAGYALASMMTKGFGAEETKAALARAEVHAGATRTPHDWTVLYGRISADMMRGDMRAARVGAEAFRQEAEALGLAGHALYARRTIAFLKFMGADFEEAVADLRTVIAESGDQLDQELLAIFGTDLLCFAQATLGHAIWYLGEFGESRRLFAAALERATAWGQVSSQCAALFNDALVGARSGRAGAVLPVAEDLRALAETNDLKFWRAAGAKLAGWARVRLGQHDAGEGVRAGLQSDVELGAKLGQPTSHALLADVERTLGRHDEALAVVARGLGLAEETGEDWVRCWLLRLRGEVLAETDAAAAESAYRDALRLAVAQGARSETLFVSIALAKLLQTTGRLAEAHAVLSDALEGFPIPSPLVGEGEGGGSRQTFPESGPESESHIARRDPPPRPSPARGEGDVGAEFPQLAEAQALRAALAETDAVKEALRMRQSRAALYADYTRALTFGKGFGHADTSAAATRTRVSSGPSSRAHFDGLYFESMTRLSAGDTSASSAAAETMLRDAESNELDAERRAALRMLGIVRLYQGRTVEAEALLAKALDKAPLEEDSKDRFRFFYDHGASTRAILAVAKWVNGDFAGALAVADLASDAAEAAGHPPSQCITLVYRCALNARRGAFDAIAKDAEALRRIAAEHGMALFVSVGDVLALARDTAKLDSFRQGVLGIVEAEKHTLPSSLALLAEAEIGAGQTAAALASIERALAFGAESGVRCDDVWLHRLRGAALSRTDPAAAETAYRQAVEIARAQGARGYALQAALPLAKLLKSLDRLAEAHAVLSDALEGFPHSPLLSGRRAGDEGPAANDQGAGALTPGPSPARERGTAPSLEMPELAEAQALLAALAETDAVKAEAARRETRSKLHAGYALATMMTKGFAADETKAALARAETAAGTARTPQYWTLLYGRISAAMAAGDLRAARAGAEAFLAEAETLGLAGHAAFARRSLGFQKLVAGDFPGAAADLRRALAETDARRDAPLSDLFGLDVVATAMGARAHAIWYLGEFDEAARLIEAALAHAKEIGKPAAILHVNATRLILGFQSGRPEAVLKFAEEARALAFAHDLKYWQITGPVWADWARARLGEPRPEAFAGHFAATSAMGVKLGMSILWGLYADVERAAGRKSEAIEAVDRALAIGAENGESELRTWLLRLRADVLAEDDPEGAEAGYREALRLAAEQGSPVLVLLAALSLAKFLNGRGRVEEARGGLSPALEGFSPTPHLPAIAEAQALLASLSSRDG